MERPEIPAGNTSAATPGNPHVLVWPDAKVAGWPPVDPTTTTEAPDLPCLTLTGALEAALRGELRGPKPHACAAVLITAGKHEQEHPRLNKDAPDYLARDHAEHPGDPPTTVEARTLFVDVDNHDADGKKRPWKPQEAHRDLGALHAEAKDDPEHPLHGAYLYATPNGWRAVYTLARPVPAHLYLGFARAFLAYIAAQGIDVDTACHPTIGRGYALPRPGAVALPPTPWVPLDPAPFVTRAARNPTRNVGRLDPAVVGALASLSRPNPPPKEPEARLTRPERKALNHAFTIQGERDAWTRIKYGRTAWKAGERNGASFRFAALAVEALANLAFERAPLDADAVAHIAERAYIALEPSLRAAFEDGTSGASSKARDPLEEARGELWRMVVKQAAKEPARERVRQRRPDHDRTRAAAAARPRRTEQPRNHTRSDTTQMESSATSDTASGTGVGAQAGEGVHTVSGDEGKGGALTPTAPSAPPDSPLLVVHGNVYFVRDARTAAGDTRQGDDAPLRFYAPTRNANAATVRLQKGTEALTEPAWIRGRADNRGRGAPRPWRQIEVDYAYPVDEVVTDHGALHAELRPWPPAADTRPVLVLPGVKLVPVEAEHDPDIERWLDAMAGDDVLGLRAWLATAHLLHLPTAALYLQGDPRVGKGLFINALRTLWAEPGDSGPAPVRFGEAIGRFNAGLERTPLVLINEHIKYASSPAPRDEEVTARFRDFIGNLEHRVEQKNQALREVRGCPRLIITANDGMALPLGGMESEQALSAVTERLRHFDTDIEAAHLIESLGGHTGVRDWIEGRRFARHVAHLREQHAAGAYNDVPGVGGTRYLVEGVRKNYHERLVLQGRRLDVLEAVALALVGGRVAAAQAGVRAEATGVVVDPGKLAERWHQLTGNYKPRRSDVTRALASLQGSTEVRRDKRRMRLVPGLWVRKAARLAAVGTDETIMRALLAPAEDVVEQETLDKPNEATPVEKIVDASAGRA